VNYAMWSLWRILLSNIP